jgi:hypothetical protein
MQTYYVATRSLYVVVDADDELQAKTYGAVSGKFNSISVSWAVTCSVVLAGNSRHRVVRAGEVLTFDSLADVTERALQPC